MSLRWRRRIIAGIDQGLGRLPVGHSSRFEGIADENRREIAHHLIKASDRLRSRRQDIRAAENRRRQNCSQPDRLDRDLDERSQRRIARPIPRQDRVAVTWRQGAQEIDPRDPHVSIGSAPKQRRIGDQPIDRAGGTLDRRRRPVELGRASERQRIGPILELRLQAHVSGPVERKDGNADDDDQHQRHIGKNDAVRVAPERFDRLLRSLQPPYSQR